MKKRLFSALIFDLDGTLIDSAQDIAFSVNHTLKVLGKPEKSDETVRSYVGDGMKTLLVRALESRNEALVRKTISIFKPCYLEHCLDSTVLYPGVRETLEFFRNKKMAVVTNKPLDITMKILKHFELLPYFPAVLGGESLPRKKPHPEPILKAMELLNAGAEDTLMIGDGATDMEAGRAACTKTCAVTYGYKPRSELEKHRPDFFIDAISDLKNIASS